MKRILLATLIITILYGCEKEKSESINPTITIGKVTHLDISGAKALYTTVNNISIIQTRDLGTNSSYALYKILADGTSSKIKVQDENGNNIEFFNSKIFPANDNLIAFNFETSEGPMEQYLKFQNHFGDNMIMSIIFLPMTNSNTYMQQSMKTTIVPFIKFKVISITKL